MVRTMSESMMRRVAGRCGAHRLQAPSGARLHGSTVPRVHGFTGMGKALRRERLAKGLSGLRVKMCVWLGVSRGLDLAFLNAD